MSTLGRRFSALMHNSARLLLSAIALLLPIAATSQQVTYYHNDVSGSPMLATDASGALVWKENYRPYGEPLVSSGAMTSNHLWFHGKPYDSTTGLSYMGARYYSPALGRFVGVDPKPFDGLSVQSFNRYAFANNNPYRFVDPDGHSPVDVLFLGWDIGKLGIAMYTGVGVHHALVDVGISTLAVFSPIPAVGEAVKIAKATERGVEAARGVGRAAEVARGSASVEALEGAAKGVTASELRAAGRADFNASRAEALAANGGKCSYCDKAGANAGDHVKSLKSFADDVNAGRISRSDAIKQANSRENITGACTSCNSSKGARELSSSEGPGKWVAPNRFFRD